MALGSLVLMRHAKSDYPPGVHDHERPLNGRGRRDAVTAGIWFDQNRDIWHGHQPKVFVSTARRAQETWERVSRSFMVTHKNEPSIYEAATSTLIDLVHQDIVEGFDVLVVGHNPGIQDLALFLSQQQPSHSRSQLSAKYPTCAIAVLEILDAHWSDSSARVSSFIVPRA